MEGIYIYQRVFIDEMQYQVEREPQINIPD